MDIKRWAGTKIGMGGAPPGAAPAMPVPGAPPAMPGAMPKAMGAGMYGPPSPPLFNPEITSAVLPPTMAAWAQAGGTAPEHPMGPPPWADDAAAFAHAQALVKKSWEAYKEPWSVVAMVYDAMKGAGGAAPPGGAPPGGPPKPGFPGAKPGLPGAKPGFPGAKPPGAI